MTTTNPEWVDTLVAYGKSRSKAPLDFQGAKVPKRVADIIERAGLKTIEQMTQEVFEVNDANGWFESERTFGEDIALLHSEVSEMLEAFRAHGYDDATAEASGDGKPIKPEGVGSEAADVLIRLLDTCRRRGIDLRSEYERKIAFNRTRGYKHGGKNL